MNPFTIHSKSQPNCPFIRSMIPISSLNVLVPNMLPTNTTQNAFVPAVEENISTFQKIKTMDFGSVSNAILEDASLRQVRIRTFSRWSHRTVPSIICIYCNLICQQWISSIDDPCEVHKILSPNCIYVTTKLMNPTVSSIIIVNESSTTNIASSTSNHLSSIRTSDIVFRASCAATTVTCFYCNGSLQNLDSHDNPMIEHARWFPYCAYAKPLCGEELYRKIQKYKRIQQKRVRAKELREEAGSNDLININVTRNGGKLLIPDEYQNFKLSIIKQCWEDQLRIKHDDFVPDCDLYIACLILRKQIKHIDAIGMSEEKLTTAKEAQSIENHTDAEVNISSQSLTSSGNERDAQKNKKITNVNDQSQSNDSQSSNLCVLCITEEKNLACIPCGHMSTCVACGHSLRLCPICRREIDAFIRIYIL
ncbi:unnamed protein product [Rotaria sp. Silwood1]|nr:unnamed protein product [Rotaria sp. Silwood1]